MDKSDVDQEDADEEEGFNNLKQSQHASAIPVKQVLPSSTAIAYPQMSDGNTHHAPQSVPEQHSNPNTNLQEHKNSGFEVHEPSCPVQGNKDDQNNAKLEQLEDPSCQVPDQNKLPVGDPQDQPAVKSEMKDQTHMETAAGQQNSCATTKQVEDAVGSMAEHQNTVEAKNHCLQKRQLPFQLPVSEVPPKKIETIDEVPLSGSEEMVEDAHQSETEGLVNGHKEPRNKSVLSADVCDDSVKLGDKTVTKVTKQEVGDASLINKHQPATPDFPIKHSTKRSGSHSGEAFKNLFNDAQMLEGDDGTPEEHAAFINELESFYRVRGLEFKPPKFYGQPLNCCKLWRSVIRLGGYDRVTGFKLWRQVGESFHPPKTCTTVSWTFRVFYEKSLLEYERHKIQTGGLQLPVAAFPEPANTDNEGNGYHASGSGRARRDAAARAMQGWHGQRLAGQGEIRKPIIKDKSLNNIQKSENKLKSIGSLKQKRPNEIELPVKAQRTETYRQLVTTVVDVGPPADWVKINVRETKDCFEVYALVPGLLREEVRVQSDPAGRLVITGQPEQPDNPWGIASFRKVVSLPARIDPLQTSAIVSLHGRLFVRVPFEQADI
ncbi:hypothetical protein ACH5RR_035368 [Cinchona calisaya]|uniref:AT-rich interactive domain-containing protein 5 n=1 Tax=Cinchona calisaya TaxID=153742 RepID=A0ABD2YDN6_9GENT